MISYLLKDFVILVTNLLVKQSSLKLYELKQSKAQFIRKNIKGEKHALVKKKATNQNHPKLAKTTYNHPKSTKNSRNHPQPSKTSQNQPEPPKTNPNHPKAPKNSLNDSR